MNKRYHTLGYMIMKVLASHSSHNFPMSYGGLSTKLNEVYAATPSVNTISRTLKDLNEQADANIHGVGGRKGLWLTKDVTDVQAETLFAPIITADYLSEITTEEFYEILSRLRKKSPFNFIKKKEPKFARQRLNNFLDNMTLINFTQIQCRQLCFTYNDLNMRGEFVPITMSI